MAEDKKNDLIIEIEDDPTQTDLFIDPSEADKKPDAQAAELEKKPRKKADRKADSGDSDIVEQMKRQLADAQREANERREAEAAEKRRTAELQAELEKMRKAQADSEVEIISSSKAAAQAKAEQLQKDLSKAWNDGDYDEAAKLQRQMARAEAILYDLDGQEATHKEKKQAQPEPEKKPAPAANDLEAWLAQAGLPDGARAWFREHPDAFVDKEKFFRVQAGHVALEKKGVTFNTDAYYDGLNRYLGYLDDEDNDVTDDDRDDDRDDNRPAPAARVSRQAPSQRGDDSRVRLSRDELSHAEAMGITAQEYAAAKRNLMKEGKLT